MAVQTVGPAAVNRNAFLERCQPNRDRSRAIFDLVADRAYYDRPIALRHPIVFYEGHLPAFSFNTLVKRGLGRQSIDVSLETLFARGIDPHESSDHVHDPRAEWPTRDAVRRFANEAARPSLPAPLNPDHRQA